MSISEFNHHLNSVDSGSKLYIGGLLDNVAKEDLVRELSKFGEVSHVWVARNPPGFAFVEFAKSADAEKAVRALDGVSVCGSRVRVEFSHGGRSKKAPRFGGRGGRGSFRRYDSPSRRNGAHSPYNDSRYYDRHRSGYGPGPGFSYGMSGYPPMMPFMQSDDFCRDNQLRRSPNGRMALMTPRGRSPISRRRSRSPLGYGGSRPRGRTPPYYDDRGSGQPFDMRGRAAYADYYNGYSPSQSVPPMINGRRDDSRGRFPPIDRRRH